MEAGEPGIYLLWHNTIMISLGHEGRRGLTALISPGADGEFAARAVQQFGVHAIRGSTSKRSLSLLRRLVRRAETETLRLAVTPDGPRGPRYQVHAGAVWIASRLGIPLRPVGMAAARSWRLRSWDRFRIPKPFTRVSMRYGAPMPVASALDRQGIEEARRRIEAALLDVAARAHADVGVSWPD